MKVRKKDDSNIPRGGRSHVITESDSKTRNENEETGTPLDTCCHVARLGGTQGSSAPPLPIPPRIPLSKGLFLGQPHDLLRDIS